MNSAPFHDKLAPASLMRAIISPASKDSRLEPPRFTGGAIPALTECGPTGQVQFAFDFDHQSPLLFVNEVAEELRYSDDHIQKLILSGALCAFTINASEGSMVLRPAYRILRADACRPRPQSSALARVANAPQSSEARIAELQRYLDTVDAWLYPTAKKTFTRLEAAAILRCSARHISVLHEHGALGQNLGTGQKEISLRIPRAQLTAFVQRRLKLTNNL